jgi:hypothetical protein
MVENGRGAQRSRMPVMMSHCARAPVIQNADFGPTVVLSN